MCDKRKVEILPDSEHYQIAAFEAKTEIKGDVRYYGQMAFGVPARTPRGTLVMYVKFSPAGCCASCFCSTAQSGFVCSHIVAANRKLATAQAWDESKRDAAKGVRR